MHAIAVSIANLIHFGIQYWPWCGIVLVWAPYAAINIEDRIYPNIETAELKRNLFFYCLSGTILMIGLRLLVWGVTGEL
jgi:hypothetical protein